VNRSKAESMNGGGKPSPVVEHVQGDAIGGPAGHELTWRRRAAARCRGGCRGLLDAVRIGVEPQPGGLDTVDRRLRLSARRS
jgi:hypothetical protein